MKPYVVLISSVLLVASAKWSVVAANTLVAIDDDGQTIEITTPIKRVITLAPFLTELVFAAGGGDRLLGVSEYSDYPQAATRIRRVAGAAAIEFETILALQPDLVLAWQTGNGPAVIKRLRKLGLNVYSVEPRTPQDIAHVLQVLGKFFDTRERTSRIVSHFETVLKKLRQQYSQSEPVKVFYQISERPLMTLNGRHIVSEAVRLCGGQNIFADLQPLAPTVDLEAVVDRRPQVILINSTIPQAGRIRQRWLEHASSGAHTAHVYHVDASLITRPTPRFADGVKQLCEFIDLARKGAK